MLRSEPLIEVGGAGVVMSKLLKTIPAISNPRLLGLEIQSLLMTNPQKTFLIRRDGESITVWDPDVSQ